jgi:hypothetical protein
MGHPSQLVGQACAACKGRIGSELDARFCPSCGCPVHDNCRGAATEPGGCPACGAPAAEVERWRGAADEQALREAPADPVGVVWYATDGWFSRWLKTSWYEDRGALVAGAEGLRFVGRRQVVRMPRVLAAGWAGPMFGRTAALALVVMNGLVLALSASGAYKVLTLDNPLTYFVLAFCNVLVAAAYPMWWVRVDYAGEDGRPGVAYLSPGSRAARWSGRGADLLARVAERVESAQR